MTTEQLLKLVDAGFSKEEIIKIVSPTATAPEQKEDPAAAAPAQAAAAAAPAQAAAAAAPAQAAADPAPAEDAKSDTPDISKMIEDKITKVFKPFNDLYNNMTKMANMPSMQDVQPKGIEDIFSDFFKGE